MKHVPAKSPMITGSEGAWRRLQRLGAALADLGDEPETWRLA
jgi:hypothetical protein